MLVVNVLPVRVDALNDETPVFIRYTVLAIMLEKVRLEVVKVLVVMVLPNMLVMVSYGTFNVFPLSVENRIWLVRVELITVVEVIAVLVGIMEMNEVETPMLDSKMELATTVEKFKLESVTVLISFIVETVTTFAVSVETARLDTRRVLP